MGSRLIAESGECVDLCRLLAVNALCFVPGHFWCYACSTAVLLTCFVIGRSRVCLEQLIFSSMCSGSVSKREWAFLKGKMEVRTAPTKATVYLEGPPVGVDLLASCFSIAPSNPEPVRSSVPFKICHCFTKLLIYWRSFNF
jgi:hypothetical protein